MGQGKHLDDIDLFIKIYFKLNPTTKICLYLFRLVSNLVV